MRPSGDGLRTAWMLHCALLLQDSVIDGTGMPKGLLCSREGAWSAGLVPEAGIPRF